MAGVVISKEIGVSEDCTGGDDTKQSMLPSNAPIALFPGLPSGNGAQKVPSLPQTHPAWA